MSGFRMNWVVVAACCGLLCILSTAAPAQDLESGQEVALATVRAGGISWQADVDYAKAVLTVAGPDGSVMRREFGSLELITLNTNDVEVAVMGDGQYSWELQLAPVVAQKQAEALEAARAAGDIATSEKLKRNGKLPIALPVVSGYFRVKGGSIVVSAAAEPPTRNPSARVAPIGDTGASVATDTDGATKDQVILDDLIVDGSLCVGMDCVNGESFGFDTLRLKENNLRIRFQDTSSTSSFPSNDWQLTANDSANGGANKFSIDDINSGRTPFTVEAGAKSHALYVDDAGRVGLGTSTPSVEIHSVDGDTPTLRLEQNSSQGWGAQTWDVAANETNFFIRDASNGSKLPFRIRPGASTSSIDISATGNVGINTSSPASKLHVVDGDFRVERKTSGGSNHAALYLTQSGATGGDFVLRTNATTGALEVRDAVAATTSLKFQRGGANNSIVVATAVGGLPRVGIGDTTPSGTLDVAGTIYLSGAQIHPDFVFESDYELESIEEHAASMWKNRHLPAVGPGEYDENGLARFEFGKSHVGLLEELEKAHIYIDQLHNRLQDQESAITTLEKRLEDLEKAGKLP